MMRNYLMNGLSGTKSFLKVQKRNESYIIYGHKPRKGLIKEVQFGVDTAE